MEIKKVLVVGSGTMGSGIAQVCAQAGLQVVINDISEEALGRARKTIAWSVGKFVEKGKVKEDADTIIGRISTATDFATAGDVDLAIEVVFENIDIKHEIFRKLDQACPAHALIASNTSAIPISELAGATQRPEQVLGLHFFNPVPMMAAVEVISGIATSPDTAEAGQPVRAADRQGTHYGEPRCGRLCHQSYQLSVPDRGHETGGGRRGHGGRHRQGAAPGVGSQDGDL